MSKLRSWFKKLTDPRFREPKDFFAVRAKGGSWISVTFNEREAAAMCLQFPDSFYTKYTVVAMEHFYLDVRRNETEILPGSSEQPII